MIDSNSIPPYFGGLLILFPSKYLSGSSIMRYASFGSSLHEYIHIYSTDPIIIIINMIYIHLYLDQCRLVAFRCTESQSPYPGSEARHRLKFPQVGKILSRNSNVNNAWV